VKRSIHTGRHDGMEHDVKNVEFIAFTLKVKYRKMVANRLRSRRCYVKAECAGLMKVALKLESINLAGLFVEAQFWCMPVDFCLDKFKIKYPPAVVCFGGSCWRRYKDYIERGIRDGV